MLVSMLSACNYPQARVQPQVDASPHAWIDAPLDGSTLPLAEDYEVVFHIANLGGVVEGEVSINDQVLASIPNPNGNHSPGHPASDLESCAARKIHRESAGFVCWQDLE